MLLTPRVRSRTRVGGRRTKLTSTRRIVSSSVMPVTLGAGRSGVILRITDRMRSHTGCRPRLARPFNMRLNPEASINWSRLVYGHAALERPCALALVLGQGIQSGFAE